MNPSLFSGLSVLNAFPMPVDRILRYCLSD